MSINLVEQSEDTYPLLCEGCPLTPEDTRAEVIDVRDLNEDEQQAYRESEGAYKGAVAEGFLQDACRVVLRVAESNNPDYAVGDILGFNRRKYGQNREQIMERYTICRTPIVNKSRFAKWVGRTTVCNGQNLFTKS